MKYILVTGGFCSSVEKGVIACSLRYIFRKNGYLVSDIKIDPYEEDNLDNNGVPLAPGLTDDNLSFYRTLQHQIRTLSIYKNVIDEEREGKYLGKTVQAVPHITNAIQEKVEEVAQRSAFSSGAANQVCIIEFGGTGDDFKSRVVAEALRQFKRKVGKENFCCVHVSHVPQLKPTNEYHTKATQSSVMELRRLGLFPDVIIFKSDLPVNRDVKESISKLCKVPLGKVLFVHYSEAINCVPVLLEQQNIVEFFRDHLKLPMVRKLMIYYDPDFSRNLANEVLHAERKIKVFSKMKYILVTGGVISGIGKGIISSSIGKILKNSGYEVTAIKIDPYLNMDAGTFAPQEHGEVFVLDDGGEVDLDLGNYERFMDITLNKDNNITTGKICHDIHTKERERKLWGKHDQTISHIQEWVKRVAQQSVSDSGTKPQICIIELGGTIGDIESSPFVEAFCQLQYEVKEEDFCCVHLSLVPQLKTSGEHKTKPTQASVRELRRLGLSPDLIVCRSELPLNKGVKEKISEFCDVPTNQVICLHDVKSIYQVPILLEEQNIVEFFRDRLKLPRANCNEDLSREWRNLSSKLDSLVTEVKIALVGKYTDHGDAYTSVTKALLHASLKCNLKLNLKFIAATDLEESTKMNDPVRFHEAWMNLSKTDGLIVPGGFGIKGLDGKMAAIQWARKKEIPFLGICLGFQLAVIEFAQNVIGWEEADSSEVINEKQNGDEYMNPKLVVIEMPEHNTGIMGGTMRKGKKKTMFKPEYKDDSILRKLYGNDIIEERHRHRYEVNKEYVPDFERAGLRFVAEDDMGERLEILELPEHPYFVAVQFHPEFTSKPLKPSAPFLGLILASADRLNQHLATEVPISPHQEISLFDNFNLVNFVYDTLSLMVSKVKKMYRFLGIV